METEEFKKTEYFEWMLGQVDSLEQELKVFNDEFKGLVEGENNDLTVVLRSHLIIEYYLDLYIPLANPGVENWNQLRLNFSKKLDIANNKRTSIGLIYPAIKSLNKMRNKYAHNLRYEPIENDFEPIKQFTNMWYAAGGKKTPIDFQHLIQEFTLTAAAFINGYINGIKNHTPNKGITGYLEFIDGKMTSKAPNSV
jgi:hypothetical protein